MAERARNPGGRGNGSGRLDEVVARARQERDERMKGYREMSLRIHPWVCGRCGRAFTRENLHLLTVHHKDHNHDNNPLDGSNWENLCIYCHDNEHSRYLDHQAGAGGTQAKVPDERQGATNRPFEALRDLLKPK
ncbi:MAG: YajD family HNH nuclease [Gammaproteobacteria bacterium]|nr:YajD family HNH nuclease [Gammaproteobacteria bacterium]